jgi:hypothetical protein
VSRPSQRSELIRHALAVVPAWFAALAEEDLQGEAVANPLSGTNWNRCNVLKIRPW